jgi:signal transduction histidine kinase
MQQLPKPFALAKFCPPIYPPRVMGYLANLLSNAVKFSSLGGAIKIIGVEPAAEVGPDNMVPVVFSVHDEGPGISKENQKKRLF